MARPREFDEATALEAAMNCFWAQGYELTSVRDLAEQMGITGASLYNAFGDKRSLYRQALRHYLEQTVRDRVARLERLRPFPAIRTFFDEIVERSLKDRQHRGCMLVNSALELAPYDPEFQKIVAEEMIFIEAFFRRSIGQLHIFNNPSTPLAASSSTPRCGRGPRQDTNTEKNAQQQFGPQIVRCP